jgi:2-dehydropantoate 2-reductase
MKILVLGAGAVGGYFGGRLAQAGQDVSFLVRPARLAALSEHGLRIESDAGNFTGPVKALTVQNIDPSFDLVILTCKAYDLTSAIEDIRPFLKSDGAILPLLNGLAHLPVLNQAFGASRVLGGLAKIAVTLNPDGVIKHLNDWCFITYGEQDGQTSARVLALKAAFDQTSVKATVSPNVMQSMWEKIVHLSTLAGLTCLMRANVGEIARTQEGAALMLEFLQANIDIATAEGFMPSEAFLLDYRKLFSDTHSTYTASMLRDIERKGPTEAQHVLGFMLDKARHHGIDDQLHRIALIHCQAYDQRRAAGRL